MKGHTDYVMCVAFSADGYRLASASLDGTVKIWDARPWTPELRAEYEARCVLTFLCDRVESFEALQNAIRTDETISEAVRETSLEWAECFWKVKTGQIAQPISPQSSEPVAKSNVTFDAIWVKDGQSLNWHSSVDMRSRTPRRGSWDPAKSVRPLCVTGYIDGNGLASFGGVWVEDSIRVWQSVSFELSKADFDGKMQQLGSEFRPTSLDIYGTKEQQRYAAVWAKVDSKKTPWTMREELDRTELLAEDSRLKLEGYHPAIVTGYLADDQTVKFVGMWVKDQETADLELLTWEEFKKRIATPPTGVFPIWLNGVGRGESRTYAVIWGQSRPGTEWTISSNVGASAHQDSFNTQSQQGYRPVLLNAD